jgi:putative copper export protein
VQAVLALHLLAAAVWAGGLVFLGVAAGVARATVPERERIAFFRALGRRFLTVALVSAAVLAGTGFDLADDRLSTWSAVTGTSDGRLILWKTILFAVALALALVHSLVLGPGIRRARERLLERPHDETAEAALRRAGATSGIAQMLILVLTVAVVVLAAGLGA